MTALGQKFEIRIRFHILSITREQLIFTQDLALT